MHPIRVPVRLRPLAGAARCSSPSSSSPPAAARTRRRPPPRRPTPRPRSPGRRPRARPPRRPGSRSPLTVGLGYIPSVQFAQFYLAQQNGYYADGRAHGHVPEQDRPGPHHARRAGRDRHRHRRRHDRHPGRQPGHPDRLRGDDLRQVPDDRLREGRLGHQDRGRPQGQEDRDPGQVRQLVDHAPGPARVGEPDARRRRHRRVPGLRPGDRAPAGRRRRGDRASPTTSRSSSSSRASTRSSSRSTTIVPLPGPGLVTGTATLAAKHDALAAFIAATLRRDGRHRRRPAEGPRRDDRAVPDLAQDPALQRQILDATIAHWKNPRTNAAYGTIDRDGWQAVARLHDHARPRAQPGHGRPARERDAPPVLSRSSPASSLRHPDRELSASKTRHTRRMMTVTSERDRRRRAR